ncbi:hypothetical protein [uncultured phage cr131_1]|uniref:Uncharacterized protein n=1 Tax=uncultured phage cr131_1 TaxID=2772093 RepID=A0A7M1RVA8_9CAUD|nr:hypothetical protein KNV60_gp17 [uncultured phage cr131_1]QOR57782.1 hypothetical protein [uncultured phage cr131_1]
MKTTVNIDSFGELYLICTIEKSYLCSTSLKMIQESLDDIHLDAKTIRSKDVLEVIINLGSASADLDSLKTLSEAALTIVSAVNIFETAKRAYQGNLNALKNDLHDALEKSLHEVSESTTSSTEESSCKGQ